jgi:hypothetical protein
VEHQRRGAEAPSKVREVGHHRGSGATEMTRGGDLRRWQGGAVVAGGDPCSILESRGR